MDHEPHERRGGPLLYRDDVFRIQGAVFEVNRELGIGFLEAVYQESLALEFAARGIPFVAQPQLRLKFKGTALRAIYVPDFVCYGRILVELKAVSSIAAEHRSQVLNYLRACNLHVGLLVNFGGRGRTQVERLIH